MKVRIKEMEVSFSNISLIKEIGRKEYSRIFPRLIVSNQIYLKGIHLSAAVEILQQ